MESAWPGKDEEGNPNFRRKWGTSFATPIAAGVAALMIEFTRQKIDNQDMLEMLGTCGGMKKVLRLMSETRSGYRYITPWSLSSQNGENLVDEARKRIENALQYT